MSNPKINTNKLINSNEIERQESDNPSSITFQHFLRTDELVPKAGRMKCNRENSVTPIEHKIEKKSRYEPLATNYKFFVRNFLSFQLMNFQLFYHIFSN